MTVKKFNTDELQGKSIFVRKKEGDTSYELHWHEYYEMILYIGCRGKCSVNDREYEIADATVFLLTPTDFHKIDTEEIDASRSLNVSFSAGAIDEALLNEGLRPKILHAPAPFTLECFNELASIDVSKDALKARSLLNYILADVTAVGETVKSYNGFFHPTVKRAAIYTLEHFTEAITLAEIAEKVGTGTAYLSSIFHETMGRTFKDWLTELRIDHAKALLLRGKGVTAVALECGFGTTSHFIKCFKDHVGITPGQYRSKGE